MLSDDAQPDLLASFLDHLDDPGAKDAYMFLVGAAATSAAYACRPQMKGVVRDFRFYEASGSQPHSFIVNKKSVLFYFRKPAVQSGRFSWAELQSRFASASENGAGEWTVSLESLGDAQRLWRYVQHPTVGFRSGSSPTTQIGYVNRNGQRCGGHRNTPGNDHNQLAYRMDCQQAGCGHDYGANGSDVFQRKCPKCQGGLRGIPY